MHLYRLCAALFTLALSHAPTAIAAPPAYPADAKVIAEATAGKLKATKGKYFEKTCNESVDFDAELDDLNGDGQPEVFTKVYGNCMGGMAGVYMNLYIKNRSGQWKSQFGFPGQYTLLKTRNNGYPDIEINGTGNCFLVWRWNGQQYAIHKKCP